MTHEKASTTFILSQYACEESEVNGTGAGTDYQRFGTAKKGRVAYKDHFLTASFDQREGNMRRAR